MASTPEENHEGYVVDAESAAEMARLLRQDQALTQAMGGIFPEQLDLTRANRILDLACGPGGWAQEVAYTYRDVEVIGIDISQRMIAYANAQARVQNRENVHFQVGNILEPLPFPDSSFDLINARLIVGFMKAQDWPRLMSECFRLLRPGGIACFTDFEHGFANKVHCEKAGMILNQTFHRFGYGLSPNGYHMGVLPVLARFLSNSGLVRVQKKAHFIDFSAGTPLHETFYHDYASGYAGAQPLIDKSGLMTGAEWMELLQLSLKEMLEEDFCGAWMLLSAWGHKD
ncbi:MAG TPA: class I SAM-dependent methyltransferase [Ktedonobacteraceae bacterium]|nr:class I SAM-dependent methyltransferase [Ktedonobacteraceae bacterium]